MDVGRADIIFSQTLINETKFTKSPEQILRENIKGNQARGPVRIQSPRDIFLASYNFKRSHPIFQTQLDTTNSKTCQYQLKCNHGRATFRTVVIHCHDC